MADFVQGLDPGKLVLAGAVWLNSLLSSEPATSSRLEHLPGLILHHQSVLFPGVQSPHLPVRNPRP